MNLRSWAITWLIVSIPLTTLAFIQHIRAKPEETWTVESCASVQYVTHKSGNNSVVGIQVYCVNSANPPYPEGTTKKPPEAPSETYDVGEPN